MTQDGACEGEPEGCWRPGTRGPVSGTAGCQGWGVRGAVRSPGGREAARAPRPLPRRLPRKTPETPAFPGAAPPESLPLFGGGAGEAAEGAGGRGPGPPPPLRGAEPASLRSRAGGARGESRRPRPWDRAARPGFSGPPRAGGAAGVGLGGRPGAALRRLGVRPALVTLGRSALASAPGLPDGAAARG